MFAIPVPKDFGNKRFTWTLVANGHTSTVSFWTNPPYWIDFYKNLANGNETPVIKFADAGPELIGPPRERFVQTLTGAVGQPVTLTFWAGDQPPTINVETPEPGGDAALPVARDAAVVARVAARPRSEYRAAAGNHRRPRDLRRPRADPASGAAAARAAERRGDIRVIWKKYRGPGDVKIADEAIALFNEGDAKTIRRGEDDGHLQRARRVLAPRPDQRQLRRWRRRRSVLLDHRARRRQREVTPRR